MQMSEIIIVELLDITFVYIFVEVVRHVRIIIHKQIYISYMYTL